MPTAVRNREHKKRVNGLRSDANSTKKLKISDKNNIKIDEVDLSKPIDRMNDVCCLCKGDHYDGELMKKTFHDSNVNHEDEDNEIDPSAKDSFLDPERIWALRYSLQYKGSSRIFFHYHCAYSSLETFHDKNSWFGLRHENWRGSQLDCSRCHKKGATIKCGMSRCNYIVHFPCAIKDGLIPSRFLSSLEDFYCQCHQNINAEREHQLDLQLLSDLSRGRELMPVIIKNDIDDTPFPSDFEYLVSNADSDDVIATARRVSDNDFQCCDCVGLCNDVNTCACLKVEGQRNYANQGLLIPGATRPLLECNIKCACSVLRCTNRVVERGLKYPLQLFRKSKGSGINASSTNDINDVLLGKTNERQHHDSLSSKGWGVMTLGDIPEGAFVCEMIGQYVKGLSTIRSSMEGASEGNNSTITDELMLISRGVNMVKPVGQWESHSGLDSSRSSSRSFSSNTPSIVPNSNLVSDIDYVLTSAPSVHRKESEGLAVSTEYRGESARDWAHRSVAKTNNKSILEASIEFHKQQKSSLSDDTTYGSTSSSSNSSGGYFQNGTGQPLDIIISKDSEIETVENPNRDNVDHDQYGTMSQPSMEAQIRNFLDGQLCIDCTSFGNIARFIKSVSKETKNRKSPIVDPSYVRTSLGNTANSTQLPMLSQRLVYTNAVDRRHPKLALFANIKIPANTELLL